MIFRKLTTLLICLMIILCSIDCSVYAAQDSWQNCDTLELQTQAFIAYCKSRDLTIEGSVLDAVTSFTTKTYQDALNGLGLNMNAIQADIKYTTDSNGGLKFLFNVTGAEAMNRIFSQWLQDHDLEVGDQVDDEEIYNGKWFVDADGNGCLVYTDPSNLVGSNNGLNYGYDVSFASYGTDYKYSSDQIVNLVGNSNYNFSFHLAQNLSFSTTLTYYSHPTYQYNEYTITDSTAYNAGFTFYRKTIKNSDNSEYYPIRYGKFIVSQRAGDLYLSAFNRNTASLYISADNTSPIYYRELKKIVSPDITPATVYITTNNTTINNNDYSSNTYTEINNEGDVNNYYGNDEPDPDEPSVPDNPSGGTPPNWDIGGGEGEASDGNGNTWNITFPDFELPDLNIDWSISGLGDKFPFSIPFDMVALITALSAEPEAPSFAGTIDFGFTTWDYDIDLSEFDSVAAACRIAELLLLVFGLMLITRSIIKG